MQTLEIVSLYSNRLRKHHPSSPRSWVKPISTSNPLSKRPLKCPICDKWYEFSREVVSVDHIIPRAVVPELDNVIANLELMPLRMNESKNAKIGSRQKSLATQFHAAGLLSETGLNAIKVATE